MTWSGLDIVRLFVIEEVSVNYEGGSYSAVMSQGMYVTRRYYKTCNRVHVAKFGMKCVKLAGAKSYYPMQYSSVQNFYSLWMSLSLLDVAKIDSNFHN